MKFSRRHYFLVFIDTIIEPVKQTEIYLFCVIDYFFGVMVVAPVLASTGGFDVLQLTAVIKNKHNTNVTKTKLLILAFIIIILFINM